MTRKNFKLAFDQLVKSAKGIAITAHVNPDADAFCSALAVYHYIAAYYPSKKVRLVFGSVRKSLWDHLPGASSATWVKNLTGSDLRGSNLLICLDGSYYSRFSRDPAKIDWSGIKTICIDHHPGPADQFSLVYKDTRSQATCQTIAEVLYSDIKNITPPIAEILLTGIIADSGNLTFIDYTKVNCLTTAARLIKIGKVNLQNITAVTDRVNPYEFEIYRQLINNTVNAKLVNKPNVTYSYLDQSVYANFDTNDISNAYHRYLFTIVRHIDNYPWGFVVVRSNTMFHLSFRSTPGAPNVRYLCEKYFAGGGQPLSAAGNYITEETVTIKEACLKILTLIEESDTPLTSLETGE